ncbi:RNA ligase [Cognatishimia sp.]|uniref:RNA ligase n=1 Tax=Cognatishimia sp. TaxID=2211648 RepID=UPI003515D886|nr:hypothetical protein [Cognatishimia sp.]
MKVDIEILKKYEENGLVTCKKHNDFPLYIWNYTQKVQHNPEFWDGYTKMCRGLITTTEGEVIAKPFSKFFNYNDQYLKEYYLEVPEDWNNALIQEKVDGSLGILYFWGAIPYIATRGSFHSEQAQIATEWIHEINLSDCLGDLWRNDHTHLFEIIYPDNRIVVDYGDKKELRYLCSVDDDDKTTIFDNLPEAISRAKTYSLEEFNQKMENQPKDGAAEEGFIVTFPEGRVKYKFDEYVKLHYIFTGLTDYSIWESTKNYFLAKSEDQLLEDNVPDEYLYKIGSYRARLIKMFFTVEDYYKQLFQSLNLDKLPSRKDQAEFIFRSLYHRGLKKERSAILFNMLDKKSYESIIWDIIKPEKEVRSFLEL